MELDQGIVNKAAANAAKYIKGLTPFSNKKDHFEISIEVAKDRVVKLKFRWDEIVGASQAQLATIIAQVINTPLPQDGEKNHLNFMIEQAPKVEPKPTTTPPSAQSGTAKAVAAAFATMPCPRGPGGKRILH